MRFHVAVLTRVGGRAENQDSVGQRAVGDMSCWVVADGLGGHAGGKVAADICVEAALESFARTSMVSASEVERLLVAGNAQVLVRQRQEPALQAMRTTAVVLIATAERCYWGHVGDSRLYLFRGGRVVHQTKDHSVPQALVDAGEIHAAGIRFHEERNRLLRSLGSEDTVQVSVSEAEAPLSGDAFLLCTDGFWEHIDETEMGVSLARARDVESWLDDMEIQIVERVTDGHDNYSALGIFVE